MSLLDLLRDARKTGDFSTLIETIPYNRYLGFEVDDSIGEVLGRMRYDRKLVGNPAVPALHGGTLGSLLESTAIFTVVWNTDTVVLPKTISLTIDYLRPAGLQDTFARATIVKRGRRVVNVRTVAWQDDRDRPVATANAKFLIKTS